MMWTYTMSTRWRNWLMHYATSRKIAGSSPDEVIEFFNLPYTSSRSMALGFTQLLTDMNTTPYFVWVILQRKPFSMFV
jgi:hypothetical protein